MTDGERDILHEQEKDARDIAEGEMMTTICVKCRHHRNTHDGHPCGPPRSSWFYQVCTHTDVERPTTIDPVSGDVKYMSKNDLGRTILHDAPHPFCRDINDGMCKMFEPKATF